MAEKDHEEMIDCMQSSNDSLVAMLHNHSSTGEASVLSACLISNFLLSYTKPVVKVFRCRYHKIIKLSYQQPEGVTVH